MNTQYTLFTEVEPFYTDLLAALAQAQHEISMMYFTFDHGEWASKINRILRVKHASGVRVRLMVDEIGLLVDAPKNAIRNRTMIQDLQLAGIQVDTFRPEGRRLTQLNRLHIKVCAIDRCTAYIGGSNIGDHYPNWRDSNLRLDGNLGNTLHQLYDYIYQFSQGTLFLQNLGHRSNPPVRISALQVGDAQLLLTLPGRRRDIRRALLDLILDAEKTITIRSWYFLPDKEILNALRSQAEDGVNVRILHSDHTRVRLIDATNYIHGHKLTKSGAQVYRYTERYMHAKVAWNDHGDIVFGSANMDKAALKNNFECCLAIHSQALANALQRAFEVDRRCSTPVIPRTWHNRALPKQALAYVCSLASPWL